MNGPAPGWQPDPTGRHEYRYWDGTRWSDDVADGGVATTDPVAGAPQSSQPAQPFGAASDVPPTTPQPTYQAGYDPSGYDSGPGAGSPGTPGAPGYGSGGYAATGGSGPGAPSGGYGSGYPTYGAPPTPPSSSGPSTGLLVGLGVLVLVLIAGIAWVLVSDGDDDGATATGDDPSTTIGATDSTAPATTATTAPPDDGGGSNDAIVGAMAEGILEGSGGALNQEEAECMAQAMVDEIGLGRLAELGIEANESNSDPLGILTSDEQDAIYDAMLNCVDASTLAELPSN